MRTTTTLRTGITAFALSAVFLAGCSGQSIETPQDNEPTSTATATTEPTVEPSVEEEPTSSEPTTEPEETVVEGEADSAAGACLNVIDLATENSVEDIAVDCSEEHDAQVFAVIELSDDSYPGDDALAALALEECQAAFEGFVGVPHTDSALQVDRLFPMADAWEDGDREVICLTFYPDLSTTTESFEGSGI